MAEHGHIFGMDNRCTICGEIKPIMEDGKILTYWDLKHKLDAANKEIVALEGANNSLATLAGRRFEEIQGLQNSLNTANQELTIERNISAGYRKEIRQLENELYRRMGTADQATKIRDLSANQERLKQQLAGREQEYRELNQHYKELVEELTDTEIARKAWRYATSVLAVNAVKVGDSE